MESLPLLYHDIRVTKLQLEYITQLARAALQPWPKKDPRDQVVENKQVTADDFTDDDESVRLLDEILEKAQIAHDASKKHGKIYTTKKPSPYLESSTSRQRNASKSAGKMGRAVSKPMGGAQVVDKPDQFTVEKHSNKMTLPSKWYRLRMAIDKHSDDMQAVGKMEGDHFVQLLQQQGSGDPNINNLLVVRSEIDAIIEDITSFPAEHWTINSRNPWQAIYRIKRHLDLIQQSMAVVRKQLDGIPRADLPSAPSITHQLPHRLTYSTLKELLDYVESYTSLQLQSYHLRINQLCKQHLLPAISSDDASASVDAALSANIRNLHSLIGLKCSPTFLHMTNDDTS